MCKIFLVAGVKPSTADKVWKFAETIAKPMSRANTDGLGYAAITDEGHLFAERWLNNDNAFTSKDDSDLVSENYGSAVSAPSKVYEYSNHGIVEREKTVAITMHTRWATTPKGLQNVHPFILDEVSLIHNGIIRNTNDFKLISTCDSEAILQSYVKQEVWSDPNKFQDAADMLKGYYACGVMFNTTAGPILDIFKANGASLYVAYVKELETFVHCTSDDDIKSVCRELGYSCGPMHTLHPNKFIRVNAATGKTISITDFKPGGEYETYNNHSYSHHGVNDHSYFNRNPQHTHTPQTGSSSGTSVKNPPAIIGRENVIPWDKKKSNTKVSRELMDYYRSRPMSCVKLSDREVQEEIHNAMGRS